jgi:hypothetical protein
MTTTRQRVKSGRSAPAGRQVLGGSASAAKPKSGLRSETKLLERAPTKVALEDDYAPKLLSMKGSVPDDVGV